MIFHAGTTADDDGTVRTAGGRVLSVVAKAADLTGAREAAERAANLIEWDGMQRRHDIGVEPRVAAGVAR